MDVTVPNYRKLKRDEWHGGGSLRLPMKRLDDAKDKMEALLNAAPGNVQVAEDHHVEGPLTEEDPASGDAADEGKEGELRRCLREAPL